MDKEFKANSNLQAILDFVSSLSEASLKQILAAGEADPAKKKKALALYRQMRDDLKLIQEQYKTYRNETREPVKKVLDKLKELLDKDDPELRDELLLVMQGVVAKARQLDPLDAELMGLLAAVWPVARFPEQLLVFSRKAATPEFIQEARELEEVYAEKSSREKEIFTTELLIVIPHLTAATKCCLRALRP